MEQQRKGLVVGQNGHSALAHRRAMELEAKHPQLTAYETELPEEVMRGSGMSGGEAGLRRVIGAGRHKKMVQKEQDEEEEMSSDDEMGAKQQAKMLAEHLGKKHGGAYLAKFSKALMKGQGMYQPAHALDSPAQEGLPGSGTGGQDVPPGGVAPVTYGNVPQAPRSFKRNTVGMGSPAGAGLSGGFWGAIASLAAPLLGKLLGSGDLSESAHAAIMNSAKQGESQMASAMQKALENGSMSKKAHKALLTKLKGKGFLSNLGIPIVSDVARVFGLGEAGAGRAGGAAPAGAGRAGAGAAGGAAPAGAGRAGAGAAGGRKPNARSALVKKVMSEQGLSMIEASKYIKEHNLKA